MGYPDGLLSSRAVVKAGEYAVIPPEGRVINVLPGFTGCRFSILASPKMGASFVFYIASVEPGGGTTEPFCPDGGIEGFLYLLDGEGALAVSAGPIERELTVGGYIYAAPGAGLNFTSLSQTPMRILLYKQRYISCAFTGLPDSVVGSTNDVEAKIYDDMENVFIQDLLPTDLRYDMNMHVLSFEPAGSHPFVETHVQEHGAYVTSGQGVYLLGIKWIPVQAEDFIYFGPFTPQAAYATGRTRFTYIYSKDCNRDIGLG
jgi:(S)-ureidoglycine aminohydrolase